MSNWVYVNIELGIGRVHKLMSNRNSSFLCGIPTDYLFDKPTTKKVTCKNCLRIMKKK